MKSSFIKNSLFKKNTNQLFDYQEIKDLFNLVDIDKKGFIKVTDLIEILESLGREFRSDTLYQILNYYKRRNQKVIYFEQFKSLLTQKLSL